MKSLIKFVKPTLFIDTLIFPAIILKIVSFHVSTLRPTLASYWLLGAAGSSSIEGQNMEGDNFQNYGGKDLCIYM